MSKYPELSKSKLGPGISYMCAYGRLERGWDFERAVNQPARKHRPSKTSEQRHAEYAAKRAKIKRANIVKVSRLFMWERPEWNAKARIEFDQPKKRGRREGTSGHAPPSTAPLHIQKTLATYCAEFIKTGVLNSEVAAKLKDYADACKRSKRDLERVPAQHATTIVVSGHSDRNRYDGRDATFGAVEPIGG